jgi:methionine--tRNA ligase beta chain
MISFEDFKKVELRVGEIKSAEPVEGSEKLLKLMVDFGEKDATDLPAVKQILSGIAKWYTPESLIGKKLIFVTNLEPRMMMGMESQGMILAGDGENGPVMITPLSDIKPGTLLH